MVWQIPSPDDRRDDRFDDRIGTALDNRPPAPNNVRVQVVDTGTFEVKWRDLPGSQQGRGSIPVHFWRVIYCPDETAGSSTGGAQFANRVMRLGLGIAEEPVIGGFREITVIHRDLRKGNGWVVVTGAALSGILGHPSEPAFVRLETSTSALAAEISSPTLPFKHVTLDGYDVLYLAPSYKSPTDMTNFAGVQLHADNYLGSSKDHELGRMHRFQSRTGGQRSDDWAFYVANDSGLGSGTATFTNSSTLVTRVSGTNFAAGWVGRYITVASFGASGDGNWEKETIASFTDINNLNMTGAFAGTTGVYRWMVLNAITFYYVSVNLEGGRRADYTAAPSVAI